MPAEPGLWEIVVDACRLSSWAKAGAREVLATRALEDAQAFLELAAFDDLASAGHRPADLGRDWRS